MSFLILAPLFASLPTNKLWYLLPLIVSISLVYGATRHELMRPILQHSLRSAVWVVGFMAIIFAVLFALSMMAG